MTGWPKFREWAQDHDHQLPASIVIPRCVFCGRPTNRVAANGKPCCSFCDDLPGKEPL